MHPQTTLVVVVLSLLLLSCSWVRQSISLETDKDVIEQVCAGESVAFGSPDDVKQFIEMLQSDSDFKNCAKEFETAIGDIQKLFDDDILTDICSTKTYEAIREFHVKYVHYYTPEASREELMINRYGKDSRFAKLLGSVFNRDIIPELGPIPLALKEFFIMFVKQISYNCKNNLVNIMHHFNKEVVGEDLDQFARFKEDSSRFMDVKQYPSLADYALNSRLPRKLDELEIVDVTRTHSHVDAPGEIKDAKLYFLVKFADPLGYVKDGCQKRFMPIYEKLFTPVIKLNNLGYVDHFKSSGELDKPIERDYTNWLEIIQTCELLKDIVVLQDSTPESSVIDMMKQYSNAVKNNPEENSKLKEFKMLSAEEVEEFRNKMAESAERIKTGYDPQPIDYEYKPVGFPKSMITTDEKEVKKEVLRFYKDVDRYIGEHTSITKAFLDKTVNKIHKLVMLHCKSVKDKDESYVSAQIAIFLLRHQVAVKVVFFLIAILMISLLATGTMSFGR